MPLDRSLRVELLWFEDCPNHAIAEEMVRDLARDLGLAVALERVLVSDVETARRLRFAGSPTVRINGVDIEPGVIEPAEGLLGCRVYATKAGLRGVPDAEWIRDALRAQV